MRIRPLDFDTEWRRAHPFPWGRNDCVNPFVCHFGTSQHSTTETKNNDPWGPQQPYLTQGFQMAGNLANQPPPQQQNPVVGFNGTQDAALQRMAGMAADGTPISGAASNFGTDLLNGNYLNSNPALGYFASLANNNVGLNNPGASALSRFANTNGSYFAPGNSTLDYLSRNNVGSDNPGTALLRSLSGSNLGLSAPGASTLSDLSKSNLGVENSGTGALQKFANGGYFSNGYSGDVAQSVMADVVPKIAAQFNQGNAINNPLVARSAAEGVTSALAPLEYQNYQAQEGLAKDAASTLASNTIAGGQAQGTFANLAASLGLTGAQLQGGFGQDVAGNTIQGANTSANAATTLGTNFLTGRQQQVGAAGNLNQGAISGGGLQATAATGLSTPYQDTLAKMVQGQALAPQTQALSYADLAKLFDVGSTYQSQAQNEAGGQAATYNFSQMSPYQQLQAYMNAVTGNYGGKTTDTKPYYTNDTANTLGTASGIASMAMMALPFL